MDEVSEIYLSPLHFYACLYQNNLVTYEQQEDSTQMHPLLEIALYIQTHYKEKLSLEQLGQYRKKFKNVSANIALQSQAYKAYG